MASFKNKITITAGILSSFLLASVLFFPIWKIDLIAPQYPEGLVLKIWSNKLSGNVETINGLNHYIGMKTLHEEDFVEFKVLPVLIIVFSVFGFLVSILRKQSLLFIWMGSFVIFSMVSMVDFYLWEYKYGHSLDPNAPIKVPGMAYQPPLIGYKQMLNFSAFSIPDVGGWMFIASGVIMFAVTFLEWKKSRVKISVASIALIFLFSSCTSGIKPIRYGEDVCDNCKMTIMDNRFAVEIISKKGKIFMMDDLLCAQQFLNDGKISLDEVKDVYVNNYNYSGTLIRLHKSFIVKSESLFSPMGGNMAAFETKDEADKFASSSGGTFVMPHKIIDVSN